MPSREKEEGSLLQTVLPRSRLVRCPSPGACVRLPRRAQTMMRLRVGENCFSGLFGLFREGGLFGLDLQFAECLIRSCVGNVEKLLYHTLLVPLLHDPSFVVPFMICRPRHRSLTASPIRASCSLRQSQGHGQGEWDDEEEELAWARHLG